MAKFNFFLSFLLLLSCRTTESNPHRAPEIADEEEVQESVPSFLWSPSRRRSTAGYYYLAAEYKALEGQAKQSHPFFETAYNLDPNPFLAGKLIAARAMSGDMANALPQARKMVLLYPTSPQLRFLYGQLLARQGFAKDAIAELEESIELDPENEETYMELAQVHQKMGHPTKAIVILKELVKTIPNSVAGWVSLAKLYLATNQKRSALEPARRAYDMQSNNPENVLIYALALELNDQSKKSIALYEQLYRINPTNEELIGRMIELYRSIGNLEESLELLNEAAALPGGPRPGVQIQRAIILWELKRYEEASGLLTSLAKQFPKQYRIRYLAGLGLEKMKELDQAIKMYTAIPESSQFYYPAQFRMGVIYSEQKKYPEAVKTITSLEDSDEVSWELYILLGSTFSKTEQYGEAVEAMDRGYSRFKDQPRLLFLKGVYQEKVGDIPGTTETMRQVLKVDPDNSAAYNYLGYLFAERGENLDEAEKLIRKALELKPGDGYYLDSLGWVFYQKKNYKEAIKYLKEALIAVPDEGVVLEHLGDAYEKLGDAAKALDFYQKALAGKLESEEDKTRIETKVEKLSSGGV